MNTKAKNKEPLKPYDSTIRPGDERWPENVKAYCQKRANETNSSYLAICEDGVPCRAVVDSRRMRKQEKGWGNTFIVFRPQD